MFAAVAAAAVCTWVLTGASGAAAGTHPVAGGARMADSGGMWGKAEEVPGTAALNVGGQAAITSVSCAAAGNCSAGGDYQDGQSAGQSFVVNEVNGSWGTGRELPGAQALSGGAGAGMYSVSCAAAGNCSAGGYYVHYSDGSYLDEAFVVTEKNGGWGAAQEVPGTAALNKGGGAGTNSVSCAAAGNCSAGGYYTDASGHTQAFVVTEINGGWGTAQEVPGTAALNKGDDARVEAVSCGAAGNCSAVGEYTDASSNQQVFVVNERNGRWGKAKEVPGTAALNQGTQTHDAQLRSVSCASAANCSAAGSYQNDSGQQVFVVSETSGIWEKAKEVPGITALSPSGPSDIGSVSCTSAGNCSAVGIYDAGSLQWQGFVVSEVNGAWGKAEAIPGLAALNQGGDARVNSVSCASAGHCSAGGSYADVSGAGQAFVVSER
jgi:hypothetical protein